MQENVTSVSQNYQTDNDNQSFYDYYRSELMVRYGVPVPLSPLSTAVLIVIIILTLYITLTILVNRPNMCSEKKNDGMQQRILIPLDGSKVGEAAIPFVEKLISIMSPEVKVEVNLLGVLTGLKRWVVVGETMVLVTYAEEELGFIRKGEPRTTLKRLRQP